MTQSTQLTKEDLVASRDEQLVPLRHWGRWVAAVIVLVLLALLIRAFAAGDIDWPVVGEFFAAPAIMRGLSHTIIISILAMVLGVVLGVVFAVMRMSHNPVTNAVAGLYIWFFRGTPVLLQLLLWFNLALVFPTINLGFWRADMVDVMTPFLAALLGLGINEGAYMTEIVRGGILSVERGQTEAALTLGMTHTGVMGRVVLPQAMRVIIPTMGNEFIGLLKNSSMAAVIAYSELLRASQKIYFVNYKVMELLIVAAAWYLIVVSIFTIGQMYLERYFGRGQAHAARASWTRRFLRTLFKTHAVLPASSLDQSEREEDLP